MMRQSSSRNQRSKGLKTKSFIQIFILAAVCFWLFYQLKHSLDKKRAMEERGSRILERIDDGQLDLIKLGRKDIPQTEVKSSRNDVGSKKEDESEEVEEEEEDQEVKRAMEDLEGRGNGDDDIDEQDHEADDEQEGQANGDEENESTEDGNDEEEKDDQAEDSEVMEEQEHDGGSQEARDASYKKDDASSAVHRENPETGTEQQKHQHDNGEEHIRKEVVKPDEAAIVKTDGVLKASDNSSTVDLSVGNETISGNNVTLATAIEKTSPKLESKDSMSSVGEAHSELLSNSPSVSEMVEKLRTNDTETGSSNFIATSNTTFQSETLGTSAIEQNVTTASGKEEGDTIKSEGTIEESTGNSSQTTTEQDNLDEHSSGSLATDIKGETSVDSSLNGNVIEEEKEDNLDLSTLPDIHANIKNLDEDSALNEI